MSVRFAVVLLGIGLLASLGPALGQGIAEENGGVVLAEFEDATALAADPQGRLYVTDAGRDVLIVLNAEGKRLQTLGGSGSRAGEFDVPSDVDPANGQVLAVADTYNGRVQRFTEEGQYLESVPVGAGDEIQRRDRAFDDGRDGAAVQGDGRPTSVASTESRALFILDDAANTVWRWTDPGGLEGVVGHLGGEGRLRRPVSLAVGSSGQLYVADAGRKKVFVYDQFGTFVRVLSTPRLPNLKSIAVGRGNAWLTCADRLVTWNLRKRTARERTFRLEEMLVEIIPYSGGLYVLTKSRLIRYSNG